jgi:hypothetical protein
MDSARGRQAGRQEMKNDNFGNRGRYLFSIGSLEDVVQVVGVAEPTVM